jgi:DnaK suppressor protein
MRRNVAATKAAVASVKAKAAPAPTRTIVKKAAPAAPKAAAPKVTAPTKATVSTGGLRRNVSQQKANVASVAAKATPKPASTGGLSRNVAQQKANVASVAAKATPKPAPAKPAPVKAPTPVRSIVKGPSTGVGPVKDMNAPSSTTKFGTAIKRDTPIVRGGSKTPAPSSGSGGSNSSSKPAPAAAAPAAAAKPAPQPQRTYVAPPAGYRPGIDPEHNFFKRMKNGGKITKGKK